MQSCASVSGNTYPRLLKANKGKEIPKKAYIGELFIDYHIDLIKVKLVHSAYLDLRRIDNSLNSLCVSFYRCTMTSQIKA